jgi:hypothetical protein
MRRFLLLLLCAVTVAQGAQKKISELDAATTVSTNVYAAVIVGDNATSTNYETMKMAAGLLLYGFMTNNTTLYFYMDGGVIKGYATNIASAQITSLDAAKLTGTIDTNRYSSQVLLLDQLNSQAEFELRLGWTLPTGGSGSSVTNTVVNTGTPIQYEVPMYNDTTGTNIVPSNISISSDGNTLTVPTEIIVGAGGTDSYWEFTEQTAPATPASGKVRVYVLADGKVYGLDDAGTATLLNNLSETELEALLELQDLQGAVTDAQVPNTITVDLATTATTANAGDSATSFFPSGTIEDARLPATMASKDLTTSTATTPSAGDNDTSIATTAFVQTTTKMTFDGSHTTPTTTNPLAPTTDAQAEIVFYGATGEIDLPAAASYTGRGFLIYNTGAFTITIDPNASEVIVRDGNVQTGGVSFILSSGAGNYVALVSDGVRWITLGYKGTLAVGS